jgi:imidazolonepropionase-like amidohydrolase
MRLTPLLGLLVLLAPHVAAAGDFAVVGGTVHTLQPGAPSLPDGVVVVRDGKIACVGVRKANVHAGHELLGKACELPAGATVVDATGGLVTPGFVEAMGRVGQVEVDAEDSSHDGVARRGLNQAHVRAIDGVRLQSRATDAARRGGVTTVVVRPLGAALVVGQSAAFRTAGVVVDDALVQATVAVHVVLGDEGKHDEPLLGSRSGQFAQLRSLLERAGRLAKADATPAPPSPPPGKAKGRTARDHSASAQPTREPAAEQQSLQQLRDDPAVVALAPVMAGKLPLVVHVHRADDIASVLRLRAELKFELVIAGGAEAHVVASRLAEANVAVVVGPVRVAPYTFATARAELANAAKLHAAGVKIALAMAGTHDLRNLRWEVGFAVGAGLPWVVALAAVTRTPAELLHLPAGVGTLTEGGPADLVVFDGDPFTLASHIRAVSTGGQLERDPRQR